MNSISIPGSHISKLAHLLSAVNELVRDDKKVNVMVMVVSELGIHRREK